MARSFALFAAGGAGAVDYSPVARIRSVRAGASLSGPSWTRLSVPLPLLLVQGVSPITHTQTEDAGAEFIDERCDDIDMEESRLRRHLYAREIRPATAK